MAAADILLRSADAAAAERASRCQTDRVQQVSDSRHLTAADREKFRRPPRLCWNAALGMQYRLGLLGDVLDPSMYSLSL